MAPLTLSPQPLPPPQQPTPKAATPLAAKAAQPMDLYHAWQAAAQTVFGAEAAAAAAHRTPRALVPAGSPAAGSVTATRVPGPSSAGKAAYTDFWFNVTWQVNATEVLPSDRLVVVWEPPAGTSDDAAINDRDPLQSAFVSALAPDTYDTTGTGSAIVWVPVMRQALRFAYVRQGEFTLWLNAMSVGYATAPPIFPNAPAGVKLTGGVGGGGKADAASLTAAPSAVSVTWQTRDIMAGGRVVWGPAGGPLDRVAPAVSGDGSWGSTGAGTVFKADTGYCFGIAKPATLSGAPWDFKSLGVINRATLSGLAPGATYEFTVFPGTATGPDDGSNFTASGTFTTPPAARDYSATTRLVVIADGGVTLPTPGGAWDQPDGSLFYQGKAVIPATIATPGSAAYAAVQGALALFGLQSVQPGAGRVIDGVLARVAAAAGAGKPIHGIAFTGDISYARGEATQWDVWSDAWWPTGARAPAFAPFLSAQGNHEIVRPAHLRTAQDGDRRRRRVRPGVRPPAWRAHARRAGQVVVRVPEWAADRPPLELRPVAHGRVGPERLAGGGLARHRPHGLALAGRRTAPARCMRTTRRPICRHPPRK